LFNIINQGSPPLDVATFDGGLFDPLRHPFLERYTVGDAHLQTAVDKLSRVDGQCLLLVGGHARTARSGSLLHGPGGT
jgi:hypothetical protein